jgi:Domain of unknown function (DUF4292)
MRPHHLLFTSLLLLLVAACKPAQREGARYRGLSQEELHERHQKSALQYKTVTLKGKADYTNEAKKEEVGFSYKVCIAKDSLIWANITKLGLPAATILIDQDSVRMRLPLTREAVLCDFAVLRQLSGLDVDFKTLQAYLVGDGGMPPAAALVSGKEVPIELQSKSAPYQVSWFLNSTHFKLEKMVAKDPILGTENSLQYGEFIKVGKQDVPTSMVLSATSPTQTRIALKHTDIKIDSEEASFSFRIPEGYTQKDCAPAK